MNRHGVRNDFVHETPVMGDEHQFMNPVVQESFHPSYGGDVKIIGRLVQKQEVRLGHKHFGQIQAYLESS